jgi:H+/Cl- antiporter ClcA
MDNIKSHLRATLQYVTTLLKWIVVGSCIGLVGGAVGTLFHIAVDVCTRDRTTYPKLMFLLPLAGIVIVFTYRLLQVEGRGTNTIIKSINAGADIPILLVPAIFIGTVLTHLGGGSAGREGAALQLGGGIGAKVGSLFRLDERDQREATLCGMSALFAALFGTPLTAAMFAMEVISVGIVHYSAFVPCLISALTGGFVAQFFGVGPTAYVVGKIPALEIHTLVAVAALAAVFAVVSIAFCSALHHGEEWIVRILPNPYVRVVAGGLLILLLTVLLRTTDYNGAGLDVIQRAMEGTARPEAFLLKILFTVITIGCGFKGGEVVPTFFVGATLGCVLGPLVGLPPNFAAALGLVSLFCGVVNCPVTSIFLAIELFGGSGVIFYALSCALSYMLSGYYGLYSSQKIMYSKLKTEYINTKAH